MVMPLAGGSGGRSQSGDAIAELLSQHYERLVAVLRRAGLDGEAEDIAQEAVFRGWTHRDDLDFNRSIWPWLRTVAFNLADDRRRSQSRLVLTDPTALPDSGVMPVDVDERLHIQETLKRLPERQRQVMRLHYLEDRDPAATARELGIDNRAAFNQLLYRARISFKSAYEWTRGLVALGVRRLEKLGGEVVARARRMGTRLSPSEPILSAGLQQLTNGMVALLVSLSGSSIPFTPLQSGESGAPSWSSGPRRVHGGQGGERVTPRLSTNHESTARRPHRMDADSPPPRADPQKVVNDALTPNHDVKDPEDARITSIVFSPGYRHDGTVFAVGVTRCNGSFCPNVLFRSVDGGKRWVRLPSTGFYGVSLLLPPQFGVGDNRIFAMGPGGLQVSEDGGKSFVPAAVAGANQTIGSAAISPAFNVGDPSILIGAQTLMRYRDDLRTVEAVPSTSRSPAPWSRPSRPIT